MMKPDPLTGLGLLVLGAGIAASAALGPLVLGVIDFRVSEDMENQLLGGEVVSLLVAAPLAAVAGALWLRGHRLAPALAIGPGLYAVYLYVQFILGPEYDRYDGNNEDFFPLYLALIVLGWATALRAWPALDAAGLPSPTTGLRRVLAGLLILLGVLFALAWSASIADVLDGGTVGQEYEEHPTLFWLVRLMDLAFIIPAALITGVGLLRRAFWSTRLAYTLVGFQTLLVGAVAGMAAVMTVRDDPSADPVFLVATAAITVALAAAYARLLRRAVQAPKEELRVPG
jgi:hypothetical protein